MDMDKVTVIGFTGSGKTTYLVGMYDTMSYGVKNFSLLAKDTDDDFYFHQMWQNIRSGAGRSWPAPSDEKRTYDFSLCYCLEKISEFEWIDYPGAAVIDPRYQLLDEIQRQIASSSCLLVLVNGDSFAFTGNRKSNNLKPIQASGVEDYKRIVANNLKNNGDLTAILRLNQMAQKDIVIPPVAIVVTKRDLIPTEYIEYISEIIQENFSLIFGQNIKNHRLVMISAVTLGEGIEDGADAYPEDIEQPIAYAVLSTLCQRIQSVRSAVSRAQGDLSEKNTFWGRLTNAQELASIRSNISAYKAEISRYSEDAIRLLGVFESGKVIYVNKAEKDIREYFLNLIRG